MAATSQTTAAGAEPAACGLAPRALTNAQWQSNLAWAGASAEEKVDVGEIWRKLWRGRWTIALVTIAGSLLGYAVMQQLTPRYTASSAVMLRRASRRSSMRRQ